MGLADVINGMLAGPRGQPQAPQQSRGGMSPITIALLGLLAYKAFKGSGQPDPRAAGPAEPGTGGLGGLLGGLLSGAGGGAQGGLGNLAGGLGGLGGLFGGASAGSTLSSGLSNLINDLQNAGHGQTAQSWVGTGANQPIAPNELGNALGDDTVQTLSNQTGMSPSDLLAALSRHLPEVVDQLTPDGRMPTQTEAQQLAESGSAG
jgi:uncharacterized protein YidB (DUF937 family)